MMLAVMYGMMPIANTDSCSSAPAGEQVDERVDAGLLASGDLVDTRAHVPVVDARGGRQRRAEPVQRDQTDRNEDFPPQVRGS